MKGWTEAMSEADLVDAVLDLARILRWRSAHFRPARTSKGWRTPVSGDGIGFPDMVLVRSGRMVIFEAKSDTGRLTSDQDEWLRALSEVPGVETYVIRPADWPDKVGAILHG